MSSDSAGAIGADLPPPERLHELIEALKTACSAVVSARRQMEDDCKAQVEQLRIDGAQSIAGAEASAKEQRRDARIALETTTRGLAELEQQAADLADRLARELAESQASRGRVDSGVEAITSEIRKARAVRDTWEAQGRATEARREAAMQRLHRALAAEKARVTALEAANKRLLEAHATLDERLTVLEEKKVFGLF